MKTMYLLICIFLLVGCNSTSTTKTKNNAVTSNKSELKQKSSVDYSQILESNDYQKNYKNHLTKEFKMDLTDMKESKSKKINLGDNVILKMIEFEEDKSDQYMILFQVYHASYNNKYYYFDPFYKNSNNQVKTKLYIDNVEWYSSSIQYKEDSLLFGYNIKKEKVNTLKATLKLSNYTIIEMSKKG